MQGITAISLSREEPRDSVRIHEPNGQETGGRESGLFEPRVRELYLSVPKHRTQSETSLFDFCLTQIVPLLLILDRRNDHVTPLLS